MLKVVSLFSQRFFLKIGKISKKSWLLNSNVLCFVSIPCTVHIHTPLKQVYSDKTVYLFKEMSNKTNINTLLKTKKDGWPLFLVFLFKTSFFSFCPGASFYFEYQSNSFFSTTSFLFLFLFSSSMRKSKKIYKFYIVHSRFTNSKTNF